MNPALGSNQQLSSQKSEALTLINFGGSFIIENI